MTSALDWNRFRTGPIGPEKAFETFVSQLFERRLVRLHGPSIHMYALHGAGGDGGVEALATLTTGVVVGLQAKWFPSNVGDREIRQIRGSIEAAIGNHPRLEEYVVALPRNLTAGAGTIPTGKNKGRKKKGGLDRWKELLAEFSRSSPSLSIVRWDENALLQELALSGNMELRALWFDGELTLEGLRSSWIRAKRRLGSRYLPDLHAMNAIQDTLDHDTYSGPALAWPQLLAKQASILATAESVITDYRATITGTSSPELERPLADAAPRLREWRDDIAALATQLTRGPLGAPIALRPSQPVLSLRWELEKQERQERLYYAAQLCREHLEAGIGAFEEAQAIAVRLVDARAPRLIEGPAGCGKTHAGAAAVERHLAADLPAVFLQLKDAAPSGGLGPILEQALDTPGWPVSRMLDGLESVALYSQAALKSDTPTCLFARCLIVIDGVEETPGWEAWQAPLSELLEYSRARPRLHFVVAARPESASRLRLATGYTVGAVDEDAGVDLPALLRRYCDVYTIDLSAVPWLGWAVRNPLTIRLFAEEFAGRTVSSSDGATANMLTLFRRKLQRLEIEARAKAGADAWSEQLSLVAHVLFTLAAEVADPNISAVRDTVVIQSVANIDAEFTAGRVRRALEVLRDYGLVDESFSPAQGLAAPVRLYGLAHRHIADWALARRLADEIVERLKRDERAECPSGLEHRENVAILFAAMLGESGFFVTDDIWSTAPDRAERWHLSALALLDPSKAAQRKSEVRDLLLRDTAANRDVLTLLVAPVARIPNHPLGPSLLDDALRSLPMTDRDILWSVPPHLIGSGPWARGGPLPFRDVDLDGDADEWNGLPLVLAWSCSSVVEATRRWSRERLALWGGARLDRMIRLLEHMAVADDPQVVEDVFVAALGAALATRPDDRDLIKLGLLVDDLVFSESPRIKTTDVIVLEAARVIVERAATFNPEFLSSAVQRARPPYARSSTDWPAIDLVEAAEDAGLGGHIVTGDLAWYVADRCFKHFTKPARSSPAQGDELPRTLKQALLEGKIAGPEVLVKELREEHEFFESGSDEYGPGAAAALRAFYSTYEEERAQQGTPTSREDFVLWTKAKLVNLGEPRPPGEISGELRALLAHAESQVGKVVSPAAVRNGMLAAVVRTWGWSEERFCGGNWEGEPTSIDRAILKRHPSATHGERSRVATFREKYVWLAVNILAGRMATVLPVWNEASANWVLLDSLSDIGNGMPDPLPRTTAPSTETIDDWTPGKFWPNRVAGSTNLGERAQSLLTAPLPDPTLVVQRDDIGWPQAGLLGLDAFRRGLHSCIDQFVRVRAWAVPLDSWSYWVRDAPFLDEPDDEAAVHFADTVYASPAIASWARWVRWNGETWTHTSFDMDGGLVEVVRQPLIAEGTARFDGDESGEPTVWMPAPKVRDAMGVAAMVGHRYRREYVDATLTPVALEFNDRSDGSAGYYHCLIVPWPRLVGLCSEADMVLAWTIRLFREPTPAIWMGDNLRPAPSPELTHRSRDTRWLMRWDSTASRFEVHLACDRYEPFAPAWHEGDKGNADDSGENKKSEAPNGS